MFELIQQPTGGVSYYRFRYLRSDDSLVYVACALEVSKFVPTKKLDVQIDTLLHRCDLCVEPTYV